MQLPSNVSPVSASVFGPKRQGIPRERCVACSFLRFLLVPTPSGSPERVGHTNR
jgi:hypothetical protein